MLARVFSSKVLMRKLPRCATIIFHLAAPLILIMLHIENSRLLALLNAGQRVGWGGAIEVTMARNALK